MGGLFMPILVISITVLVFIFFFKTPTGKGWLGEYGVNNILGRNKIGEKYKINNFTFKYEDKTVQIDHLFINKNGIFVIETKNFKGRVYGNENSQKWTQVFVYGKRKYKVYNPIRQNRTHIFYLKEMLKDINV